MRTKHLFVLIHIRYKGDEGTIPSNMFKPSSIFLADRYKVVLLLWIFFLLSVFRVYLSDCLVVFLQPCGHQLGNGLALGSLICHVFVTFPICCPGPVVVFDLHRFLIFAFFLTLGV